MRTLVTTASSGSRILVLAAWILALGAAASAQLDDGWVGFERDDARLVAEAEFGSGDTEEKDLWVGDLDRDGWDDLVIVRKQPFITTGRRTNVLLMNEGGVLVDRTAQYAAASTVPGDQGFLTPTNDTDVIFADVDGDGWLDVITATTLSSGQPQHISHPRVYMNLGNDGSGNWLGLEHQAHRIPQLLVDGQPCWPRFDGVAAGDVTGNGLPDLYFVDYDNGLINQCGDMNDRLLVNDGTGVFVDESSLRLQAAWLASDFGTSVKIADMNGDGHGDIVKNMSRVSRTSVTYNDPNNPGHFYLHQVFHQGVGYHVSIGDLNQDGRIDAVISDERSDRYLLNQGTDVFGRVIWGPDHTFDFVVGGDGGFAGVSRIADLDLDGWPDVLIADGDCLGRAFLYHNRGGIVGGAITLREEAGSSGWRGAVGLMPSDLEQIFDFGVLDIDRDGYPDLVLAGCTGTRVWMNTLGDPPGQAFCFCDGSGTAPPCANPGAADEGCRNSTGQGARLSGSGSASAGVDSLALHAHGLLPGQPALLFAGENAVNGGAGVPFGDGLRCAGVGVLRVGIRMPDALGRATWGPGLVAQAGWTPGQTRRLQAWYRDPIASPCGSGFNLTPGYAVTFGP